jgi:opacity protein-like surface antigen
MNDMSVRCHRRGNLITKSRRVEAWSTPGWIGVATALAFSALAQAQTPAEDGWQFEVTPYLWGSSLKGTVGARRVRGELDAEFSDIWEHLDSAFLGAVEARRGRWGLLFDMIYFKLVDEPTKSWQGPGGIGSATGSLEATSTMQVYQFLGAYRIKDSIPVDLVAGARYTRLDADLNLTFTSGPLLPGGTRSVSGDESWLDPVVGIRVLAPIAEHWTGVLYADYGGFGLGSDKTYQLTAGLTWQFTQRFSAKAGYRYVYQDYEKDGFVWDVTSSGPLLGLGIRF